VESQKSKLNRGQSAGVAVGCLALLAAAGCFVAAIVFGIIALETSVGTVINSGHSTPDWGYAGGFLVLAMILLGVSMAVHAVMTPPEELAREREKRKERRDRRWQQSRQPSITQRMVDNWQYGNYAARRRQRERYRERYDREQNRDQR
jgi:uncharacterized membrane protein YgaE (UPF0421/DUF939 family)